MTRRLLPVTIAAAVILLVLAARLRLSDYYDLALFGVWLSVCALMVGWLACQSFIVGRSIVARLLVTAIAALLVALAVRPVGDLQHRRHCESITLTMEHMLEIGRGLKAYRLDNDGFYPYDERGPLESLALLYPRYISDPKTFTSKGIAGYWFRRGQGKSFPKGTSLTDAPCHYGYGWPVPPNAKDSLAILSTIPECYAESPLGYCILYADIHVSWVGLYPMNPSVQGDHLFALEPGWGGDTDSYIRPEP